MKKTLQKIAAVGISAAILALTACGGGGGGGSAQQPVSAPVTVSPPGSPTGLSVTTGKASANVVFTAPAITGGSPITGYTVSSSPAGGIDRDAGSTGTNHLVTGLINGVSYTFTVTATNAAGTSAASSASGAVTPSWPPQWTVTGGLNTARADHTATLLPDGSVLVVGGTTAGVASASVERFDPANGTWTLVGTLSSSHSGHTATLLPNGKLLIVGGGTSSIEQYDLASNKVVPSSITPAVPTGASTALLPNGKVLIIGGLSGGRTVTASTMLYDPETNIGTSGASMAQPRWIPTTAVLKNGKVMVIGGENLSAQGPHGAELFDPTNNTWTDAAAVPIASTNGSATVLQSGKLLFVSGRNAALYDPATDSWTLAGSLSTDHVHHTATLLPNGTVLLVGGGRYNYFSELYTGIDGTDVCELYDPSSNTWSMAPNLVPGPVAGHTATLLRSGSVLVVGGASLQRADRPARVDAALYE